MDALLLKYPENNQSLLDGRLQVDSDLDVFAVTMAVVYLIVCVAGLAGNALVVVAILKFDKLSSSTTVYVLNLAMADGLFMVGLPFIASQNFQHGWMFGDVACKVVMVLDGINQFTSVFCLTAMSVDRYMALADPLLYARWRTPRCAKVVSVFLWLSSLVTILPMAVHFTAEPGFCVLDVLSDRWWVGVLTYTFVAGFALPFVVMTAAYTALLLTLRANRSRRSVPVWESHQTDLENQRLQRKSQQPDQEGQRPEWKGQRPEQKGQRRDLESHRPDREGHPPDREGQPPDREGQRPDRESHPPDRKGQRLDREGQQQDRQNQNQRMERQITRMVVAVVVVFGFCWLPFYILNFCSLYHGALVLTFARAFEFAVLLSYSWSCANPILYACLSNSFRKHFHKLLCPAQEHAGGSEDTDCCDLSHSGAQQGTILL